ncbi:fibroblast growth factor receptor substrate 2 [Drosophila madeirensis]|uniref:Fibroblast growth factor receptor substrate 2 n=1 Tax=Drosophila madeirensis TaxID=30013 RepID=A0AAU9FC71_DROMD
MGCITSTNKLNELRHDNVFRVRVAHLQPSPGTPIIRSGYLELTPRELIFLTPGCEPIVWALQHLRRYGLNADLFSFEAGRRCMSGPGIYTFRVHNADQLYPMFQRYINAVNTDAFAQGERERMNSAHSVSVLMGRTDANPHSNNYLEPAPIIGRNLGSSLPESANANASFQMTMQVPTETTAQLEDSQSLHSPVLPFTTYANAQTNVYLDQPLRAIPDCCKDGGATSGDLPASKDTPPSRLSMRRRTLDMPPLETAPPPAPVTPIEGLHMYANVETPVFDLSAERCYENVNRLELPLPPREVSRESSEPATPTSLAGTFSGVNYIVLDLDQPRSPISQCSPRLYNGFGSGLSLVTVTTAESLAQAKTAPVTPEASSVLDVPMPPPQSHSLNSVSSAAAPTDMVDTSASKQTTKAAVESSTTQGYSTIDFIRTYALNKSSTELPELRRHPHEPHEAEELRITRHSKCIRKAYSISE